LKERETSTIEQKRSGLVRRGGFARKGNLDFPKGICHVQLYRIVNMNFES